MVFSGAAVEPTLPPHLQAAREERVTSGQVTQRTGQPSTSGDRQELSPPSWKQPLRLVCWPPFLETQALNLVSLRT